MLKAGIVGLPNVGKSTLFNAVTRTRKAEAANYPFCTIDPNVGIVTVPDARLEPLAKIAKTNVVIPAAIEFVDIAGLVKGASAGRRSRQQVPHATSAKWTPSSRSSAASRTRTSITSPAPLIPSATSKPSRPNWSRRSGSRAKTPRETSPRTPSAATRRRSPRTTCSKNLKPHLNAGKPALTLELTPEEKAIAQEFLPAHRQADDFRLQRQGNRPRHRRQKSVRPQSARIRQDASRLRSRRHQRADRERPD